MGGLVGGFKSFHTLSKMGVRITSKGVCKLIKPGNTKGSALVHRLANMCQRSTKRVFVSKTPMCRGGRMGTRVTCVPSRPFCFLRTSALRVVHCFQKVCRSFSRGVFCHLRRFFPKVSVGHGVHELSGKVRGRITF